ncbi:MAG: hydroxymethylglutaryl-CoA reductase [Spirochaetaceae bacterium]|nr:MAG: hydroxymethylglutaryl-CoA reductase [Spirochaetaceae bacterium]
MSGQLPKNRQNDYSREAIRGRIEKLSTLNGRPLKYLEQSAVDPELTKGNIENIIGFSQVPVGIIGPLAVNGSHARGEFYVPLSTTEGALVASYHRGARAITMSGGANVLLYRDMIQRAPLFVLENVFKAAEFIEWFDSNFDVLQKIAGDTTAHGALESYHSFIQGRIVFIRLNYSTGDAMGMNMATKATHEMCNYIDKNFAVERYVIESNLAVDKKPSAINTILGRGKSVTAEAFFTEKVLSRLLRTTATEIDLAYKRQVAGGLIGGVLGSSGHVANGLAAIFLACGQDMANLSESCVGHIYTEVTGNDLYVSLNMPSLIIATIGGGVSLPTQKECLEIMDCYGDGKAGKFAEIVAATLLAGEISLAASLVAGDFVSAHEKYGRNRPDET